MSKPKREKYFRRFGIITIVAVYLLILVGGIVRSTGSGMGCPDWPKCFGMWIPPTDISQLPTNYQEIYQVAGHDIEPFNAVKTWVEYINRLIGALIGFFILITLVLSTAFWKKDRIIFVLSLFTFLLVFFQAWIGAKVVSTNLAGWMITIHMVLAILIVFLLIYAVARSHKGFVQIEKIQKISRINMILIIGIILSLLQVVLGTQVRENIDEVAKEILNRSDWIANLDWQFYIHRSFSLFVFFIHLSLVFSLRKNILSQKGFIYKSSSILLLLLGLEILTGVIMAYFAVPPFLQPIHLLLSIIILGVQFMVFLWLNQEKVFPNKVKVQKAKELYVNHY